LLMVVGQSAPMAHWDLFRKKPIRRPRPSGSECSPQTATPLAPALEPGYLLEFDRDMPFSRNISSTSEKMERTLSIWDLIGFEIGSIIGPGIFVTTGLAAKVYAGPAIALSFVGAAALCVCAGLVYCEFGARIPSAGGAYAYVYSSLGELPAFVVAALMSLQYFGVASGGCRAAANYIVHFCTSVGLPLPGFLLDIPISQGINLSLLAPLQSILLTMIIMRGTNMSTAFGNIVATANVIMIVIFIVVGLMNSDTSNWTDDFCPNGAAGVLSGSSVIFYAFNGFDAVGTLAEEIPNPEKLVPRGLLGSLAIVTVAYVGIGFALTGMVHYSQLDDVAPFAHAFVMKGISWAFYMITFSAVLNCWASSFASIMAQPRLLYAVAKDGLIPSPFKKIDPTTKTPLWGTAFVGGFTALCSGIADFSTLAMTVSCGILLVYVFVGVGLLRIRYSNVFDTSRVYESMFDIALPVYTGSVFIGSLASHQGYAMATWMCVSLAAVSAGMFGLIWAKCGAGTTAGAQFLCPAVPVVPLVSIAANCYVALSLGLGPLVNVVAFVLVCSLAYVAYGASHSKLACRSGLRKALLGNGSKAS